MNRRTELIIFTILIMLLGSTLRELLRAPKELDRITTVVDWFGSEHLKKSSSSSSSSSVPAPPSATTASSYHSYHHQSLSSTISDFITKSRMQRNDRQQKQQQMRQQQQLQQSQLMIHDNHQASTQNVTVRMDRP
jgi:hypothetical protein